MAVYLIKRETLVGIADAIRETKGITGTIPVTQLNEAFAGGVVIETAKTADAEYYQIQLQTLIDIADAVRRATGNTDAIAVKDLAREILETGTGVTKLATPRIYLDGTMPDVSTSAVLGQAILGKAILGYGGGSGTKLATPIIRLVSGDIQKLDTPTIRLEVIADDDPDIPDIPEIEKLDAPIIRLEIIEDEPNIEKLATPTIRLEVA